jgi:hypothetical protein
MSNKAGAKEEEEKPDLTTENENSSTPLDKPDTTFAFPSEHVPTFLIREGPVVMNVNKELEFLGPVEGGFAFRHRERPHHFRRVAVEARLFGVTELIYQNVNSVNKIQLWLHTIDGDPQITFDNRSGDLMIKVDQELEKQGPLPHSDPTLADRFDHIHPGSGGSMTIQRIQILDEQDRVLYQNFSGRDYEIILFKEHL